MFKSSTRIKVNAVWTKFQAIRVGKHRCQAKIVQLDACSLFTMTNFRFDLNITWIEWCGRFSVRTIARILVLIANKRSCHCNLQDISRLSIAWNIWIYSSWLLNWFSKLPPLDVLTPAEMEGVCLIRQCPGIIVSVDASISAEIGGRQIHESLWRQLKHQYSVKEEQHV